MANRRYGACGALGPKKDDLLYLGRHTDPERYRNPVNRRLCARGKNNNRIVRKEKGFHILRECFFSSKSIEVVMKLFEASIFVKK